MRKSWHYTYLSLASKLAVDRSDHDFPVGAAVVDIYGNFVLGYNGLPRQVQELSDEMIIHAEMNALNNARFMPRSELKAIYVTYFPCLSCAQIIIQSGIKEVYVSRFQVNPKYEKMSKKVCSIFHKAGITLLWYDRKRDAAFVRSSMYVVDPQEYENTGPVYPGVLEKKLGPEYFLI